MARSKRNTRRKQSAPGWLWMLCGVGIGLVIAAGFYYRTVMPPAARPAPPPVAAETAHAPAAEAPRGKAAGAARGASASASASKADGAAASTQDRRFEFYDILPQYEVVVPDSEPSAGATRVKPIEQPGSYVLQAGSFGALADADRLKASIALLGIESRIQRVTIDDAVFHRVRIGPVKDLDELNRMRKRLHDAHIDAVVMKATE